MELNLLTLLPKVRRAFDAGELQCQKEPGEASQCLYSGPCAVGVGIPENRRRGFDSCGAIDGIIREGFIQVPADQADDFMVLQFAHDQVASSIFSQPLSYFEKELARLEAKYVLTMETFFDYLQAIPYPDLADEVGVTEEVYDHFLNVLPPAYVPGGFQMIELRSENRVSQFIRRGGRFYHSVVEPV